MEYFVWNTDPNIIHFGSIQLRWYGLLFVTALLIGIWIMSKIFKREGKDPALVDNMLLYVIIGVVIGARLAHCLLYEPQYYLSHPLEMLKVWEGGLASHGGMVGVLIALYVYAKKYNIDYIWLIARITIPGTIAAAFVRFGNFFNSEIVGNPTTVPWAVIFERVDMIPRHPVQLYEALAYILLLLILIGVYLGVSAKQTTRLLPGIFLSYMFTARFLIEYFKSKQEAYNLGISFSTGQLLSIPFIIIGIVWIIWAWRSSIKDNQTQEHT